jgi:D-arabinose 1-dehydrogenase-like Zn-dependent alcohol dehydrogenase
VILSTVTDAKTMSAVIGGLSIDGKMVVVGVSPEPIEVPPFVVVGGRRSVQGWPSGTSIDSEETLAFSALANIRPMIETMPLKRAAEAYERMMKCDARFRMVVTTGLSLDPSRSLLLMRKFPSQEILCGLSHGAYPVSS